MINKTIKYIARFRQGHGAMAMNAIDYYKDEQGRIVRHQWSMGGSMNDFVELVPDSIKGYRLIENKRNE
tara:strand:+ start:467 stop:673 length:207 start_codon:yes stop_codon:yes gene_type:complete